MIKAIIFDCFGVIITDGLQLLCDELAQKQPQQVRDLRSIIHAANRGIIASDESSAQISDALGITIDEYRQKVSAHEVKNQSLIEYIQGLRSSYRTGLLSNITVEGLARRFSNEELAQYFDVTVVSSEVGYAKPDREIYQIAAHRLGMTPGECVFVDDREPYCAAATDVGMQAIVYRDFAQFQSELQAVLKSG